MPEDMSDLVWFGFLMALAVVGFFLRDRVAGIEALEKRVKKVEDIIANLTITETQIMTLLKEQKADSRERIDEIKKEVKELRVLFSDRLDKIYERVMHRSHNEREND